MEHIRDCCESVCVEDIWGEIEYIIGSLIMLAEESSSSQDPEDYKSESEYRDSFTWTFYRVGTINGAVVIRWLGEPNGYYSESVEFWQSASPQSGDAVDPVSRVTTD